MAPEFRIDGGRGFDAVFFVSDEDVKIDLDLERASVGGVEFWIEDVEEISVVDRVEYDDLLA